ncbi:hypothetical protein [Nostoc sp.]
MNNTPIRQGQHFTLTLHGQVMKVTFHPYRFANYGHIEFKSPYTPPRRIPVRETGYRSHFVPMHEIEEYADIESCAREMAIALMNARPQEEPEERQLTLF